MSDSNEPVNPMKLICRAMRETGEPMSRLDIVKAIEPVVIPNLRDVMETMLKAGFIRSHLGSTENQTVVVRYMLSDDTDCDSLEIEDAST